MSFVTNKALKGALEEIKSEFDNNLPNKVSLLENDVPYAKEEDLDLILKCNTEEDIQNAFNNEVKSIKYNDEIYYLLKVESDHNTNPAVGYRGYLGTNPIKYDQGDYDDDKYYLRYNYIDFDINGNFLNFTTKNFDSLMSGNFTEVSDYLHYILYTSDYLTAQQVDDRFQQLIGAAPADLDTLEEIAEKLQDGDDIHTALVQSISEKLPKSGGELNGKIKFTNDKALINAICDSNNTISNVLYVDKESSTVIYGSPKWSNVIFETSSNSAFRQKENIKYKIWDEGNDGSGSGLDADLLDGKQSGITNNNIVYYIDFPNYNELANLGYVTQADKQYNEAYLKGLCKWAIDKYPTEKKVILQGVCNPNSLGWVVLQVYGTDGKDSNGIPRYCSGQYNHLTKDISRFGTIDYVWYYDKVIFSNSNVEGANKLISKKLTNEDLNDIKDEQFTTYHSFINNTCSNKPVAGTYPFGLTLMPWGNKGTRQIFSFDNEIYSRIWNASKWSSWKKMLTEDDISNLKKLVNVENRTYVQEIDITNAVDGGGSDIITVPISSEILLGMINNLSFTLDLDLKITHQDITICHKEIYIPGGRVKYDIDFAIQDDIYSGRFVIFTGYIRVNNYNSGEIYLHYMNL